MTLSQRLMPQSQRQHQEPLTRFLQQTALCRLDAKAVHNLKRLARLEYQRSAGGMVLRARLKEANMHWYDQPRVFRSVAKDDSTVGWHVDQFQVLVGRSKMFTSLCVRIVGESQRDDLQQSPRHDGTSLEALQQATELPPGWLYLGRNKLGL